MKRDEKGFSLPLDGEVPDLDETQHEAVIGGFWPSEGGYDFEIKQKKKLPKKSAKPKNI